MTGDPRLALLLGTEVMVLQPDAAPDVPFRNVDDAVRAFWTTLAGAELARAHAEATRLREDGDHDGARSHLLDAATRWAHVVDGVGAGDGDGDAPLQRQVRLARSQVEVWDYLADPESLQSAVAAAREERNDAIEQLAIEQRQTESLSQQLDGAKHVIAERERELAELLATVTEIERKNGGEVDRLNAERTAEVASVHAQLAGVYASSGWRALTGFRTVVEKTLPRHSPARPLPAPGQRRPPPPPLSGRQASEGTMAKDARERSLAERGARRVAAKLPDPAKAALNRIRRAWRPPAPPCAPPPRAGSAPPIVDPDSDGRFYRTPVDLAVTATPLNRILVIGSCFMGFLAHLTQHWDPPCDGDLLLFNHIAELPDVPPHGLDSYDFQVVQMPLRNIVWEHVYFHLPYDDPAAWEKFFEECCERLALYLRAAMRYNEATGLLTFVVNYLVPQQDPMGRFLPKKDLRNLIFFIDRINEELAAEAARYRNTYVIDVDQVAASFGRKYIQDDAIWHISHNSMMADFDHEYDQERIQPPRPLDQHYTAQNRRVPAGGVDRDHRHVPHVEADRQCEACRRRPRRHPVAGGGRRGERGHRLHDRGMAPRHRRGAQLPEEAGRPARDRQQERRVQDRGAVAHHLPGAAAPEDFAARRINWDTKVDNLGALLKEVNLLPRNVVYIDDNPVERAAVQAAFPDIRVLGADLYYLRRVLLWSAETQVPVITEES